MERTAVRARPRDRSDRDGRDDRPVERAERRARPDRGRGPGPLRRLVILGGAALLVLAVVVGYALTRPSSWQRSGPPATVSAWAPYWQTDSAFASFSANSAVFSDLSLFAYRATGADAVGPFDGLGDDVLDTYRSAAHGAGVKLTASIIDDMPANGMAAVLADPTSRAVHVRTIVQFAQDIDVDGIDIDYEKFAFSDGRSTWDATRPNWVAFITELAAALHAEGKTLTVSAPPSGDYWVYDYEAIGAVVDAIRIMAYDYSTSEPGPIAPIEWVTDVVKSAKDLVPASKLVLGVPVYGYDWPIETVGICPGAESDQPRRRNVSSRSADELAATHGVVPTWDEVSRERTFAYTEQLAGVDEAGAATSCTVTHRVWYADAEAVHARAYLAERQDLAGISLWSLGSDDARVWDGIAAARDDIEDWPPAASTASTTAG